MGRRGLFEKKKGARCQNSRRFSLTGEKERLEAGRKKVAAVFAGRMRTNFTGEG